MPPRALDPLSNVTAVALVCGFSVLSLSGCRVNADMGLMSSMTIALALGLDFVLLPALHLKVDSGRPGAEFWEPISAAVDTQHPKGGGSHAHVNTGT